MIREQKGLGLTLLVAQWVRVDAIVSDCRIQVSASPFRDPGQINLLVAPVSCSVNTVERIK